MTVLQLVFRSTLQLQISKPDRKIVKTENGDSVLDNNDIWGFGSGFIIIYKDRHFFVTADHNVHPEDHDKDNVTCQRTGHDYNIEIITNNPGKDLSSQLQPVGGFYHYTGFDFGDSLSQGDDEAKKILLNFLEKFSNTKIDVEDESLPVGCRIPDLPDFAVSNLNEAFKVSLLTNMVVMEEQTVVIKDGERKVSLIASHTEELPDKAICVVGGTVLNKLINGDATLSRINIIHEISYSASDSNSKIWYFDVGKTTDIDQWEGLSGAPVLNSETGQLIGMLVNGPGKTGLVAVIPINRILQFIDMQLRVMDYI